MNIIRNPLNVLQEYMNQYLNKIELERHYFIAKLPP